MLSKSPEYPKTAQGSKDSGIKFYPVREYLLMRKENLVSATIDEPQTLSTATGFMFESAARIFGPRFDIDSWSRTMLRTQGDLQVNTPISFGSSPFAKGFMELAQEAAKVHDRDGYDPINEYLAAQTYLFAMKNQLQQDADRKDSFGNRRFKLSLINLLTSTNIEVTEKIDIDKKLRPLTGHTTAEERRIHAMEQRLAVFAHSQNLTQMAPILDDLARDIYDTIPVEEKNAQSIAAPFEQQTGKATKRKRQKANSHAKSKTLQAEQYAGLSEEHRARLERREKIRNRPAEIVGAYGQEWEHKSPAKIASNAAFISTEYGNGWLAFESDRRLRLGRQTEEETKTMLRGIKEIYVIQHGVMRNAKDYHEYFIKNFNKAYDPETMLVIAPQFLAPIDLQKRVSWDYKIKAEDLLRWGYNSWRAAEPALNKDAPIDSFTAMDELISRIIQFTPNLQTIEFRGNSEGGQFLNRYLAFSKKLNQLETDERPIKIRGILSNPGTVLHLIPTLPIFDKYNEFVGWKEFAFDDPVNRWGLGLYDPSPYILESLNEWPHGEPENYPYEDSFEDPLFYAIKNLLRRTTFAIGEEDDIPGGFHLPMGRGPGPKAQGPTRLKRMIGLFGALSGIVSKKPWYFPPLKMMILNNVEHDASDVFKLTEEFNIDYIINDNLGFSNDL